jgi:hypothetical protein
MTNYVVRIGLVVGNQLRPRKTINFRGGGATGGTDPPPGTAGAVTTSASILVVRIGLVVGNQLRPKKTINFRGN